MQVTRHHSCRVSPFGHPRIHARLTAPRGITQPPTSFIGSQCQGIHHAPLNTYTQTFQKKLHRQPPTNPATTQRRSPIRTCLDARNHYPQIKHHTPPPKTGRQHANLPDQEIAPPPVSHNRDEEVTGLLSQSPIVCLAIHHRKSRCGSTFVVHQTLPTTDNGFLTASGVAQCHNLFRGAP